MITGVYAGTFDPITKGHLNIIRRSLAFCDKLYVAIGVNQAKKTLFTVDERLKQIRNQMADLYFSEQEKVEVTSFSGLIVNLAQDLGASLLIRGVRSGSDFEYEMKLAQLNKQLAVEVETIFIPTQLDLSLISSSAVKELALHGAPIYNMVSSYVEKEVYKKLGV